jgi:methyl-coenzyme M reductase gamma subunit
MLRRQLKNKETGHIEMVKNQIAIPLDEPIDIGEPLDEDKLKSISTIYRVDGDKYRDDKDAVEVLHKIHLTRTQGGYNPE